MHGTRPVGYRYGRQAPPAHQWRRTPGSRRHCHPHSQRQARALFADASSSDSLDGPACFSGLRRANDVFDAFGFEVERLAQLARDRNGDELKEDAPLLTRLCRDEPDVKPLSQSELVSNLFIFLLAGHDTTTQTLSFALALLATRGHEVQERIREEVDGLVTGPTKTRRPLVFEDLDQVPTAWATLYETLRMFPQVVHLPKCTEAPTPLHVPGSFGAAATFVIPAHTTFDLDTVAVHYHPAVYSDPEAFCVDRWFRKDLVGASINRGSAREHLVPLQSVAHSFFPWSQGTRQCIGMRLHRRNWSLLWRFFVHAIVSVPRPKPPE